jgi:hypothetical protein
MSATEEQAYEDRCKVEDRVNYEWHEYIADVNTYAGPNGPVQLPNTGTTSWYVDPQGVYHQPANGQVPDGDWKLLNPIEPGDPGWPQH